MVFTKLVCIIWLFAAFSSAFSHSYAKRLVGRRFANLKSTTDICAGDCNVPPDEQNGTASFGSIVASQDQLSNISVNSLIPPHRLSKHQFVYVLMTSIFVTCLIIADVIGVKLFEIKLPFKILGYDAIEHTCGMITFPVTFLLGDIINEYYGPRAAKDTIYIGLAMSILVFVVMNVAQMLPFLQKPFNGECHCLLLLKRLTYLLLLYTVTPEAFDMIFGSSKLMYLASMM